MTDLLTVEDLSFGYSARSERHTPVLSSVSFALKQLEILAVIGMSGVGKTTLLRLVCGLEAAVNGKMSLNGSPISGTHRDRGIVFQSSSLFEWLTVRQNVDFARENLAGKSGINHSTESLLHKVGLLNFAESYPSALSGGLRQRLAIVRALAACPRLLCLDEPFSALDPITKETVRRTILEVSAEHGIGILLVSHDIRTALLTANRCIVLAGSPAQVGGSFDGFRGQTLATHAQELLQTEQKIMRLINE